jgi:cell division protein ZapE
MTTPLTAYRRRLASGELAPDRAQADAAAALERLYEDLEGAGPPPRGWRRRWRRALGRDVEPIRGIYLWGSVGRGKTCLLDLFYSCLPFDDKMRQHFHRFMGGVHEDLKLFRRHRDPLELIADRLAERTRIICFDEFAVTDIADAMILGTLFRALFARGVTLAATSNTRPDRLYHGGLQRQRFLPTIAMLERHTDVVHVDGALDYRLRVLERADVYQCPAGEPADARLAEYFRAIAPDEGHDNGTIAVLGRAIPCRKEADGVVWFDFAHLCDGPRSQADYVELSRCYQTVLVSNVPQLDARSENQARRFIALVDEFYDRKVKLILSAAVPLRALYGGAQLRDMFMRTASRLEEMQSHDYLAAPHLT